MSRAKFTNGARYFLSIIVLSSLTIIACGGGGGGSYEKSDIKSSVPAGTFSGTDWSMIKAEVKVDSFDSNKLSVTLYAEDVETCGFGGASGEKGQVFFSVKKEVGDYPLSFSLTEGGQTVTMFTPPMDNLVLTEGVIVVKEITDTTVTIGLVAGGTDNTVNGTFTADLCQ